MYLTADYHLNIFDQGPQLENICVMFMFMSDVQNIFKNRQSTSSQSITMRCVLVDRLLLLSQKANMLNLFLILLG